ncbi:MAG TPA: 4a-hydroxytetrahydrobiopterin dehydratase [Rhodocyclaceae bacterium]|nr:4a-hydroxytetrahydrobiopterin dehydratase [Rhodocyclaceae bacterium]
MTSLALERCAKGQRGIRLDDAEIAALLHQIPEWATENGLLIRTYLFGDHYQTLAFVNAAAWVSHTEDHHPELHIGYNRCRVEYSTHDCNGLSRKDFICAAKLEKLYGERN